MANNGWFRCTNCGYEVKILVPDWVKETKCSQCGGTMKKK